MKYVNDLGWSWRKSAGEQKKILQLWYGIRQRERESYWKKHKSYAGCSVCERWHILSNFVADLKAMDRYNEWLNSYNDMALDKDSLVLGNKEYAPDKVLFLTKSENSKEIWKNKRANTAHFHSPEFAATVRAATIKVCGTKIYEVDDEWNILGSYDSMSLCADELGVSRNAIHLAIKERRKIQNRKFVKQKDFQKSL